jgi:hypothetical protein
MAPVIDIDAVITRWECPLPAAAAAIVAAAAASAHLYQLICHVIELFLSVLARPLENGRFRSNSELC